MTSSGVGGEAERAPLGEKVGESKHGSLYPGDTIEVHYVYSTAQVKPGPTLAACLDDATTNPQLRVEAQVLVLVNDPKALNFVDLAKSEEKDGYQQALNILNNTGSPIQYIGSTTGPTYNEKGSPFQVTWAVRPEVAKAFPVLISFFCAGVPKKFCRITTKLGGININSKGVS